MCVYVCAYVYQVQYYNHVCIITGSRSFESYYKTNPVAVPAAAENGVNRYTLSQVIHS